MNPSKYDIILKIVDTNSFSKTAEYFQYSQSSISQTVKSLESEFGITLFNRTPHGVVPTSALEKLLPTLYNITFETRRLNEQIEELADKQNGTIRLGSYVSLACYGLPELIYQYGKQYPNIKFELYQLDDIPAVKMLQKGLIDLCLMCDPHEQGLKFSELYEDPFVVVVPNNFPTNENRYIPLEALKETPFFFLEVGYESYINEILKNNNVKFKTTYTMTDDRTIMAMVERGFGFSILPKLTLARTPYKVKTLYTSPNVSRHIGFVVRNGDYKSLALKTFIKFARNNSSVFD